MFSAADIANFLACRHLLTLELDETAGKRFRAEGDFLLRALVNSISISRTHVHRLEPALSELEELAGCQELPRDFLKHFIMRSAWSGAAA